MLRVSAPAFEVAFSERSDGDLRVTARSTEAEPLDQVQGRILELLEVPGAVVAHQVHGTGVLLVDEPAAGYSVGRARADAVVTPLHGVAVAVHVADCLPIALGGEGAVAMLHAGWRGLADGIVAHGVRALRELSDGPLAAVIGPGAGGCCYETGEEVRERFAAHDWGHGRLLDLKAVAAAQLREAGVARVDDVALCTICSPRFFSHRREGAQTGRQGGYAWLR